MQIIRAKSENKYIYNVPVSDGEDDYEESTVEETPPQEGYLPLDELDMKSVSLVENQRACQKLPPLSEIDSRPLSAVSTTSSVGSLPKIESRFLPK